MNTSVHITYILVRRLHMSVLCEPAEFHSVLTLKWGILSGGILS